MSSRRIGSFTNLSPIQELAINPFSTFNSDSVNKLTRTLSNGKDGVCFGLDVRNNNNCDDVIDTIQLFKSNDTYNESEWNFDSDFVLLKSSDNTKLEGLRLNSVTEYKCLKFKYIIKASTFYLTNLIGNDINTIINFNANISIGCPKRIILNTNDRNVFIDYPKTNVTPLKLSLPHNLKSDTDEIVVTCSILMDPNDVNTTSTNDNVYNGQSYLQLDHINFSIDITNRKTITDPIATTAYNHNYSDVYIHPTECLYITPGIAIKDDLMMDFKMNPNTNLKCIVLDLNKNTSWIKNNPFVVSDFYREGSNQKAYVYNNRNRTTPLVLNGEINDTTKRLNFWYGDITSTDDKEPILLMDEYQISNYDENLDFTITKITSDVFKFKILEHTITNSHKELYGTVAYILDKRTNSILHKFNLTYDQNNFKYSEQEFEFTTVDIKLKSDEVTTDNLKIVACIGPIKVSGDTEKLNSDMIQWANVVVYYTYFKHPRPNKAYIGLIRDEDLNDERYNEDYLVLARVRFVSANTVDLISYENRNQIFTYNNIAKHINFSNQLTDDEKQLWINPKTGEEDVPSNVSDALNKLRNWFKDLDLSPYVKKDSIDNSNTGLSESDDRIPSSKLINNLIDKYKNVQPDWNQTDSSQKDFIKNKPTIPETQIQSDWNQTDSSQKDFIKNKPTIPESQIQSDWNVTDTSDVRYINNKPTIPESQKQSDWNQTDESKSDFIKNKPKAGDLQLQSDWSITDTSDVRYINNKPENPIQSDWNQTDTTKQDFIKNKPTIPESQIQSDWNQTDESKSDFIKNKPTIEQIQLNAIIEALYPIGSIYITLSTVTTNNQVLSYGTWEIVSKGRCLWGYDPDNTLRSPGGLISAALPNITGSLENISDNEPISFCDEITSSGCIKATATGTIDTGKATYYTEGPATNLIEIDASKSNSIYSNSCKTVQPPAYIVVVWRRKK